MAEHKSDCREVKSPQSKAGQIIGNAFETQVLDLIASHLSVKHPEYELLHADVGKKLLKLEMVGGISRQMDNVIVLRGSNSPVALMETKWLKDARHHNDKGAWMLQLREVRKKHASIRGATAILAGYWTEGVGVMLLQEGGVKMVLVATDEQIYETLQPEMDRVLGADTYYLDPEQMRSSYIRPVDFLNVLCDLQETGRIYEIAKRWLELRRPVDDEDIPLQGKDLVTAAIDDLLGPLPDRPNVQKLEIALQIDTGNTIYEEFTDIEEAQAFLLQYFNNPDEILKRITPKPPDE